MDGERRLFQHSLTPQLLIRPSWRRALGWGAVLGDCTLATVYSGWRLGCLILPAALLLWVTKADFRKADQDSDRLSARRRNQS
jgi:hypothetical protein